MVNWKRVGHLFDWAGVIVAATLICGFFYLRQKRKLPPEYVGSMEANHPWIVFNPTMEQGLVSPWGDKQDPDVVYLVFVGEHGDSVRINLKNKEITPYHFNVANWEDVQYHTTRYSFGQSWENPTAPLWTEFRGRKEERVVEHTFGYPVPNQPGTLKIKLRSGYLYIMDERSSIKYELLRVKIVNSDLSFAGLGTTYISPNQKWVVFRLANEPSRTFVFNREEKVPEIFPTDRGDQPLEVWKQWGETMGTHP